MLSLGVFSLHVVLNFLKARVHINQRLFQEIKMPFTKDHVFPSDEALTVEEVPIGTPYLKAGGTHLGKYCEPQNNEFMLCRLETNDASKCLEDGKAVTNCANNFFRQVCK